jgi:putative transposase
MIHHHIFDGVRCAYHLHYHFCFQTKFNRQRFATQPVKDCLAQSLQSVCSYNNYHLLGHSIEDDRLYCLISLKPDAVVSTVARTLKSNLARQFNLQMPDFEREPSQGPLWSIGYYVGSVGKASKISTQRYIDSQGEHHGIRDKQSRDTMRWINPEPPNLRAAHVTFDLSYHVVLVTSARTDVFDRQIAPDFFRAMTAVSREKGFYIERMSLLYDHVHALVRATPSLGIRDCVQDMMNHSLQFMIDRYAGVLKSTKAYNLWTESFYVSTVGQATTAQIKSFLRSL